MSAAYWLGVLLGLNESAGLTIGEICCALDIDARLTHDNRNDAAPIYDALDGYLDGCYYALFDDVIWRY